MEAQQLNLDVIANNLANVNTTGFKKSKIEFQDLLYQTTSAAGAQQGAGNQVPTGVQVGHGARVASTSRVFTNGEMTQTGERMDIFINGDGFFEVQMPDGSRAYTRAGAFKVGSDGNVKTSEGLAVLSGFQPIPPGTTSVTISSGGTVALDGGSGPSDFQLTLSRFVNPAGLRSIGRNLFIETPASGGAEEGQPGVAGYGSLEQGYLEMSNVKVVEEMVKLIMAQRAYEVNSKAVQAADEMLRDGSNLRR
jgi:flagellar basal-body rod protein FlgG